MSLLEGASFILLMGVAMPLKYLFTMPQAVQVLGWVHGALFIALCFLAVVSVLCGKLNFGHGGMIFLAALLPCGPFLLDKYLRRWEKQH